MDGFYRVIILNNAFWRANRSKLPYMQYLITPKMGDLMTPQ